MQDRVRRHGPRSADSRSTALDQRPFSPKPPVPTRPPPAPVPVVAPPQVQITLQTKSAVDSPSEPAERAADQVAEQVSTQIAAAESASGSDHPRAQPVYAGTSPGPRPLPDRLRAELAAAPTGQPLAEPVQRQMEQAFGHSFARVRVHADGHADRLNHGLQAHAFTVGNDVFFRRGAYRPASPAGRQLLAHELTHVVQQRGHGGNGHSLLQRKSVVAVAVALDPTANTIAEVNIAGRPEHKKFAVAGGGSAEGDHTTAWALIRVTVTNRLRNKTLKDAVAELHTLLKEAKAMPGANEDRLDAMGGRGTFATEKLEEAEAAADAANKAATTSNASTLQTALQSYIAAYLTFRNAIGLNVAYLGTSARSGGEAEPLAVLQYWEQNWTDSHQPGLIAVKDETGDKPQTITIDQKADILNALGVLYSAKVDDAITSDVADVPGRLPMEQDDDLIGATHKQYHASVRGAFPNLMQRLKPTDTNLDEHAGSTWQGTVPEAAKGQQTGVPAVVQIAVAGDTITHVQMSGRPKRDAEGGTEGDHTTAFVVTSRTIERALIGKTLKNAAVALAQVEATFRAMPGTEPERIKALSPNRQHLFATAERQLTAATKQAKQAATVDSLQRYAMALLFFRNSMALSVVKGGNLSDNKGEQDHIETLGNVEQALASKQKRAATSIVRAIASLFDDKAVDKFNNATNRSGGSRRNSADEAPGSTKDDTLESLFAAALLQHLLAIKAVAPNTFNTLNAEMVRGLAVVLGGTNSVKVDAVTQTIAPKLTGTLHHKVTGVDRLTTIGQPPKNKKRNRRQQGSDAKRRRYEEEEWTP